VDGEYGGCRPRFLRPFVEEPAQASGLCAERSANYSRRDEVAGRGERKDFENYHGDVMKKGWKIEKLGNLCEKITDGTHVTPTYVSEGVPFLSVKNLTNGFIDFSDTRFISREEHEILTKRVRPERDDILYTKVGTTGIAKVVDVDEEFSIFVSVALLKIKHDLIFNRFLEHFLNSPIAREQAQKRTRGMANKNLVITDIKEIEVHYPISLPEQQRIVSMLDKALASFGQVKDNAERNLINARELFEALLNEYFGHPRKGWKEMKLNDACIVERGSSPRPIKKYQTTSKDGVNWIKIGDTKGVEKYIYSTKEKITKEGAEHSRFVKEGDFILTNSMSFGNPYIMKTEGYIHDGWFVLRLKEFIDTEFFWFLLVSPFVRNQFNQLASGAIVKNISGDLVKKAVLFIPPLAEQRAIVERLEALSAETGRLEEIYQQKVESLEELKRSVLAKAFEGEL